MNGGKKQSLEDRAKLKTYSHLESLGRMPTTYELVTSRLLYEPTRGLEIELPLGEWYKRHRDAPARDPEKLERFADPRATTYASYCARARAREEVSSAIFTRIESSPYDRELSKAAIDLLARGLFPARHLLHGMQMVVSYFGQIVPSGRVMIVALFQAADEMRRIQTIARRIGQLENYAPEIGARSRRAWMDAPEWQPLRKTIEELLVTYNCFECFAALNLCLKPVIDTLLFEELPRRARAEGDFLLGELCHALALDGRWHLEWTFALTELLNEEQPQLRSTVEKWLPIVEDAAARLASALDFEAGRTETAAQRREVLAARGLWSAR